MASLATISKELGLSKATVSRAFDPRFTDLVRPATRKRIFDFCQEHDYHPSLIGRSFSTGKTFKIGVVSSAATDKNFTLFSAILFGGITAAAIKRNYTPLRLDMTENPANCRDQINSSVADAYIINSISPHRQILELFKQKNIPVIVFDTTGIPVEGLPMLTRDIRPAYRQFWRNLPPEDRGRTAFVGRGLTYGKWRDLQESAPRGVKIDSFQISEKELHFLMHRDSAREFAEKELDRLLKYKLLWCSSDLVALGICDTLKKHGVEPGKDIYLAAFGFLVQNRLAFFRGGMKDMYFYVQPGVKNFMIEVLGTGAGEWVSASLRDPAGREVASCKKNPGAVILRGERADASNGEVWNLRLLGREDHALRFGAPLIPVVSPDRDMVFTCGE